MASHLIRELLSFHTELCEKYIEHCVEMRHTHIFMPFMHCNTEVVYDSSQFLEFILCMATFSPNNKYDQTTEMWQLSLRSNTFWIAFFWKTCIQARVEYPSQAPRYQLKQKTFSCQTKEFNTIFEFLSQKKLWIEFILQSSICIDALPMENISLFKYYHVDINSMQWHPWLWYFF